MKSDKLIVASAGSGKTTHLINETLANKASKILITTFTEANEAGIQEKFIKKNRCVPSNVKIQTWFSFLLDHGVKPYQSYLYKPKVTGLVLVNESSAPMTRESDVAKHYFTKDGKIYSDKLSKFVFKCNEASKGLVIRRLAKIYSHIFIDEVQDLAGYDLDLINALLASDITILMVGDPRQGTYSTNNSAKNKKYRKSQILHFFESSSMKLEKDETLLTTNYRSNQIICDVSSKLYPTYRKAQSGNKSTTGHDGVFVVRPKDLHQYLSIYNPVQLIHDIRTKTSHDYPVLTYGKSKGLEFPRTVIYPTKPILDWISDTSSTLAITSRSKLYVALTRAEHSVAIIMDYKDEVDYGEIKKFNPSSLQ
ncbi:MAG: UvrD-helicase domain-containing protein [Bacteroidetes bacterium]|nr:UvrD-helicase domain-containing protein [Bacteroidota bacterium]